MQSSNLWHIVGAGAVGQFFAYQISQKKIPICLHAKNNCLDRINFKDSNNQLHDQKLHQDDNQIINTLIICTKSFSALQAFEQYKHRLNEQSIVLCLFNGLGPQFEILNTHKNTFFATTTHGIKKINSNSIIHTGAGITTIGHPSVSISKVIQSKLELINFTLSTDILEKLYLKLAINSLINPLTALKNCKNGELLENQTTLNTMKTLAYEIESICSYKKIKLDAQTIFNESCEVAKKTARNHSSMQQDVLNKRQTEIDLINGYWVKEGIKHNIPTPENAKLVQQISTIL